MALLLLAGLMGAGGLILVTPLAAGVNSAGTRVRK
jgi:hypothetical protein